MQTKIFILLLISGFMFFGCNSSKNTNTDNKKIELEGEFRSVKGVMDNLSCYCYNSGYLTLDNGDVISICFENDDIDIKCVRIKVKGVYKEIKIEPDNTNPCPEGEEKIFFVEKYECVQ